MIHQVPQLGPEEAKKNERPLRPCKNSNEDRGTALRVPVDVVKVQFGPSPVTNRNVT